MKKINLLCVSLLTTIVLFTSCLKDSVNISEGSTYGKVTYYNLAYMVDIAGDKLYSPDLEDYILKNNLKEGQWLMFNYKIDMNAPENANHVANNYLFFELQNESEILLLEEGLVNFTPSDTTAFQENEILLNEAIYKETGYMSYNAIIGNTTILMSTFEGKENQEIYWDLYYDNSQEPKNYGGHHVYTLFLRAREKEAGTGNNSKQARIVSYDLKYVQDYIHMKEKQEGNLLYYIDFKFIKSSKEVDGEKKPLWVSASTTLQYQIPQEQLSN